MIQELLTRYFGVAGSLYLIREMKALGFEQLSTLDDGQKIQLANALVDNVFSKIMSLQKREVIYSQILKELSISKSRLSELSKRQKEMYELSSN
jgi:hypothetical protein